MILYSPTTIDEAAQVVRDHACVVPCGAQSKPSAIQTDDRRAALLDMRGIAGITEYEPSEFTFTALAGTPLRDVSTALAQHRQYLPFDPPLSEQGATIGGTIAAGVSGSGRLRYGGLRDFLIGVRFLDGEGSLIHGGGKVVKNAAGFDLPKLMVGSMGRLGVLVEATFKVFPQPPASLTIAYDLPSVGAAIATMARLTTAPLDLDALDMDCPSSLIVRLAGEPTALEARAARVDEAAGLAGTRLAEDEARAYWHSVQEFEWVASASVLVKAATTPARIPALDSALEAAGAARRYSVAGNAAWIAWPEPQTLDRLDHMLTQMKLAGVALRGTATQHRLGSDPGRSMAQRVKRALDPVGRFLEL